MIELELLLGSQILLIIIAAANRNLSTVQSRAQHSKHSKLFFCTVGIIAGVCFMTAVEPFLGGGLSSAKQ